MELMEAILARRSIRRYRKRDIPEEFLAQLVEAVRWAPSWGNTQCWEVIVVRDPVRKEQLQTTLSPRNPASTAMLTSSVVFVLCAELKKAGYYKGEASTRLGDWFLHDLGLAAENLCLAAHGLGLGSVIVGAFEHDQAGKLLELPEGYQAVTMIPVGWPDHSPSPPKRRDIREFIHYEHFGGGRD